MDDEERRGIHDAFDAAVNMTPAEIEAWLKTGDSKRVGQKDAAGDESVGHASGRRIVAIRRTHKADLTDDDYTHMRKVAGYVARHCKQGPAHDREQSDWRYSLMNWGHDPCK